MKIRLCEQPPYVSSPERAALTRRRRRWKADRIREWPAHFSIRSFRGHKSRSKMLLKMCAPSPESSSTKSRLSHFRSPEKKEVTRMPIPLPFLYLSFTFYLSPSHTFLLFAALSALRSLCLFRSSFSLSLSFSRRSFFFFLSSSEPNRFSIFFFFLLIS